MRVSSSCIAALWLLVVGMSVGPARAEDPSALFDQRILPILKSSEPSSCVQCHLASVDLKKYVLPSAEKTFASLRDQGLIDLDRPEESRILALIKMGESDPDEGARLIHRDTRRAEWEAFAAWIKSCCADPAMRDLPRLAPADVAQPDRPDEVIRHGRKSRLLDSFVRNVWSQRMRCFPCHTPHEVDASDPRQQAAVKTRKELERNYDAETLDRLNLFGATPAETMRRWLNEGRRSSEDRLPLINFENPRQSLLVLKPTSKLPAKRDDGTFESPSSVMPVSHMGGLKMHRDDHSYKSFVAWIRDCANVVGDRYDSVDDLPADDWYGSKLVLRLTAAPEDWPVGTTVQLMVHARDEANGSWRSRPVAFTQGTVTPRHIVNGGLFLLWDESSGGKRPDPENASLPRGDYLVKVYLDRDGRLDQDPTLLLGPEDFAGQAKLTGARWREGFRHAESIPGSALTGPGDQESKRVSMDEPLEPLGEEDQAPWQRGRRGPGRGVYKTTITPHWFDEGRRFWYVNELSEGRREYVLVDTVEGKRARAFDHQRLAEALREAGVGDARADRLALERLEFDIQGNALTFRVEGDWRCNLDDYRLKKLETRESAPDDDEGPRPLAPEDAPNASRRTGPETELTFVNRTGGEVELFWLDPSGRPVSYGKLTDGGRHEQHTYAGHVWRVVDARGRVVAVFEAEEAPGEVQITAGQQRTRARPRQQGRRFGRGSGRGSGGGRGGQSPDGKWVALTREGNVLIRPTEEGSEVALSTDGSPDNSYQIAGWSPDSRVLVAFRVEPGDRGEVHLIESSPRRGGRAVLHSRNYALPGDKFDTHELNLFLVDEREQLKPEVEQVDFGRPRIRWNQDGRHFTYEKVDRGHQRFRLIEVDAHTGESRALIDERSDTFIWTAHTENVGIRQVTWLENTDEIVYVSEMDGWRHLYLVDSKTGEFKNQITQGEFVVRRVDRIDEDARQIWFRASGRDPDQDPYLVHFYRVDFDGTGLVALTGGDGNHSVQYSPDRTYLIDTYSRVDMAPVHQLRRVSDGELVCDLEQADTSLLRERGWSPPEVFVAKGRDGETDIWGIICRPRDFDPSRKYPILEDIYAGPQGSFVPKTFSGSDRYASLTELGFIVVKIDGMGTANRSKAFHDVCWKNLKDAGLPDRILWIKAAAEKYPYMDVDRVGIYGTSAGGQNAASAVLFHPEFYKAAVASCGCHDNRMDKASWNEQWMGYPVGPQYAECSNIDNAGRLQGKLMLIVGEMDTNVPPESTMRFADALIKADKDFDLIVVPGAGHGNGGAYGRRRMHDFFVEHLLGEPDRASDPDRADGDEPGGSDVAERVPADDGAASPKVTTPPDAFFDLVRERDRYEARRFYAKHVDIGGLPVVASAEVADEALSRTHDIVSHMLAGRPDVLKGMIADGMYLIIIGKDQVYTDMPENRNVRNPEYMNERVRGTGGKPTSFGEENLLSLPIDRYDDESIAVHEFCHTIDRTLRSIDPTWRRRLDATYRSAISRGLWRGSYAASNPGEYWAEICQSYFDCNRVNNWNHGPVGTREQLREHDPDGYELVHGIFNLGPEQDWRYEFARPLPNVISPPSRFQVDPHYTKFTWAREFPVVGRGARDEALLKANDTIRKMFAYRHDILKALINEGVMLVVLGDDEKIADLPQYRRLEEKGGIDADDRLLEYSPRLKLLAIGQRDVLADPVRSDRHVIRLFADALFHVCATRPVDPDWENRGREVQQYELNVQRLDVRFDERLGKIHQAAVEGGKCLSEQSKEDRIVYWADGVMAYFDAANRSTGDGEQSGSEVVTREALKRHDPELYALVHETMAYGGRQDWRYGDSR